MITTKLNTPGGFGGKDWAHAEIEKSLEAWNILEDYYNRGVFRTIGVSNFEKEHLDLILESGKIKPAVNQIESHVGKWNEELIACNEGNDIATVVWPPLGGIDENAKQVLEEIGELSGKTYAQVVLRYQMERDVIVIPKSRNKYRQAKKVDIFDFELTANDRERNVTPTF